MAGKHIGRYPFQRRCVVWIFPPTLEMPPKDPQPVDDSFQQIDVKLMPYPVGYILMLIKQPKKRTERYKSKARKSETKFSCNVSILDIIRFICSISLLLNSFDQHFTATSLYI